jgi:hypothetical protein
VALFAIITEAIFLLGQRFLVSPGIRSGPYRLMSTNIRTLLGTSRPKEQHAPSPSRHRRRRAALVGITACGS